ncbi:uncharacterized protein LOC114580959 [Dendrobium catenatum]|uniref:uncharacterized protein LOC114580959 n=1 Tax=Dendrobium catenatum TaxID=906689 RepID=UPI0010A07EDB|nr:uncharacterized protein LOC114580959 [Dendrobium catenatum]
MQKLWQLKGSMSLLSLADGFFLLKFSTEEDLEMVLSGGPWFLLGKPFILQRWSPNFKPKRDETALIPIWIKIVDFPLALWTPTGISKISSYVGIPISVDSLTANRTRLTFARIFDAYLMAGSLLSPMTRVWTWTQILFLCNFLTWEEYYRDCEVFVFSPHCCLLAVFHFQSSQVYYKDYSWLRWRMFGIQTMMSKASLSEPRRAFAATGLVFAGIYLQAGGSVMASFTEKISLNSVFWQPVPPPGRLHFLTEIS